MAFQGNFGRVTDIKFRTLSCGTNQIVDKDCFLTVPGAKIRGDLTVNNDTLICGNLTVKGSSNLLIGNSLTLDTLDMNCGILENVELLEVNTIVSKGGNAVGNLLNVVVFNSPPIFNVTTSGGGARNQFWGFESGITSSSASDNVAMGYHAMQTIENTTESVAIGANAGAYSISTPSYYSYTNQFIAIGHNALRSGPAHTSSIGIGNFACENISTYFNIAIGNRSCQDAQNCSVSIAIGEHTLSAADRCVNSITIGGHSMSTASYCFAAVAIGRKAMKSASSCFYSTAIGYKGMYNAANCSRSVAIGPSIMEQATNCDDGIMMGYRTMWYGSNHSRVIAIGYNACYNNSGSSGGSSSSIFIGEKVCRNSFAIHYHDIIMGFNAGYSMGSYFFQTNSRENVAIGKGVFQNALSQAYDAIERNVAIGLQSMYRIRNGDDNVAVGRSTMSGITYGNANIAIGSQALFSVSAFPLVSVYDNISIGRDSMGSIIGGITRNIAIGFRAMQNVVTVAYDSLAIGSYASCASTPTSAIAIGTSALAYGADSIAIGRESRAPAYSVSIGYAAGSTTFSNCVALGNGAVNTVNDQISLGGPTHTSLQLGGGATALISVALAMPTDMDAAMAGVPIGGIYRNNTNQLYIRTT